AARGDVLPPAAPGEWLRGAARLHRRSHARRDGGGARRRCLARAARLPHRVRCAGVRALLPERDGGSGAEVVRDLRSRARVATQVRPHLRAVLFDWGDTLFHAPHAPEVILSFAARSGVPMSIGLARALWDELWAAGKTPEEIAKGRDHSLEVGAEKPDPAIFLAAAKSLGVAPNETLMVGDHAVDAGAERAGMRAFILPAEFDGDVRGLDRVLSQLS